MIMIITGVANPGGRAASLNRFARCSGWTRRLKEPLAPRGICLSHRLPSQAAAMNREPDLLLEPAIATEHYRA